MKVNSKSWGKELRKKNFAKFFLCVKFQKLYNRSITDMASLKLVSAIFYQIFIFSPYDSPSETVKNVFYFIQKALFLFEIFKFL